MSFINMPLIIRSTNGCNFQAVGTTLFISHIHWVLIFKLARLTSQPATLPTGRANWIQIGYRLARQAINWLVAFLFSTL